MEKLCIQLEMRSLFCKFFKDFTGEMNPCSQTHLYAAKQSEKLGEAYTFFCPAGLIHYTVPVIKKGIFRGSVLAGPILMEFSDQLMISEIMQRIQYRFKIFRNGRIKN